MADTENDGTTATEGDTVPDDAGDTTEALEGADESGSAEESESEGSPELAAALTALAAAEERATTAEAALLAAQAHNYELLQAVPVDEADDNSDNADTDSDDESDDDDEWTDEDDDDVESSFDSAWEVK